MRRENTVFAAFVLTVLWVLPAIAQSTDESAKRFHVLPNLADGSGWRSSLLITNVSEEASQCTLQLSGLDVDRFEAASARRTNIGRFRAQQDPTERFVAHFWHSLRPKGRFFHAQWE